MQRTYDILMQVLGYVLVVIFSLMVVDVLWQVLSRYALGAPSSFTEEFARFALIWVALLGAAYLNGLREHLTMDFLTRKLSPEKLERRQKNIEWWMFGFALVVMVVGGGNLVLTTLTLGQASPAIGVPLWVVYSVIPVSGALVCFFSVYHAMRETDSGLPNERLDLTVTPNHQTTIQPNNQTSSIQPNNLSS